MSEVAVVDSYYKTWGHGRSWVVHKVNSVGDIVWASHWFTSKEGADAYLSDLR